MTKDFRSAVFELCKKLDKNEQALKIRQIVDHLTYVVTRPDDDPNVLKKPPHGDLGFIASHQRKQFLGYLLTDESVDEINKNNGFNTSHLDEKERYTLEVGYQTIDFFIQSCLSELKEKFKRPYILCDPYINIRRPVLNTDAGSFLKRDDIKECIETFQRGGVYKKVLENDTLLMMNKINEEYLEHMSYAINKELIESVDSIPKDLDDFIGKLRSNYRVEVAELLEVYDIYCYALSNMLLYAAQMIFDAILGNDMVVMDNDCIISIDGPSEDFVYKKYTALIDRPVFGVHEGTVGSICLLVCDPSEYRHIKEFGVLHSLSVGFNRELGQSSKVVMHTVDEELNPIHNLTTIIMNTEIGRRKIVYDDEKNSLNIK